MVPAELRAPRCAVPLLHRRQPRSQLRFAPDTDFAADLEVWCAERAVSLEIVAAHDLDDTARPLDRHEDIDLRWLVLRMITAIGLPSAWRGYYSTAAAWFLEVASNCVNSLHRPGVGEWSVPELLGHTGRAFTTVVDYLGATGTPDIGTAEEYFRLARTAELGDPPA